MACPECGALHNDACAYQLCPRRRAAINYEHRPRNRLNADSTSGIEAKPAEVTISAGDCGHLDPLRMALNSAHDAPPMVLHSHGGATGFDHFHDLGVTQP